MGNYIHMYYNKISEGIRWTELPVCKSFGCYDKSDVGLKMGPIYYNFRRRGIHGPN